ncbi:MAG: hypothetical protein M3N07_04785, partial [Pseudomonadota bacterium]|nr:hypothetical protein [Pseudomonadota bacterium]
MRLDVPDSARAEAAVDVRIEPGFAAAIDAAAAAADERHRFLRTAWFAAWAERGGEAGATT